MAGTWNNQNKILPGAYINFLTNAPLSITPGERGTVLLLLEVSVGTAGDIYTVTALENDFPAGVTAKDTFLAGQACKGAQTVKVYNLGSTHDGAAVQAALEAIKTVDFDVLVYPYDGTDFNSNKAVIADFISGMVNSEGKGIQGVLANHKGDFEGIINVTQGVKLTDGTILTAAETTPWVAGITAGANINRSNTGKKYQGAIDVVPRKTKAEMEAAITNGEFIFKVDSAQNVTAAYDINSLTTLTEAKGKPFTKNRVIRTLYGINNDITEIFESNYVGQLNNNQDGRSLLRATLVEYFNELQRLDAIKDFTADDVTISKGSDSDAVVVDCYVKPVDSVEKMYITVKLS